MMHSLAVVVDGADLTSPASGDADALHEAGCDDALLTSAPGEQRLVSDREAPTFADAVASAITAIETGIPGARVLTVERIRPDPATA